uniref:Noggin (Trinotate prediction) n=1 Tax=Myxobolus squamalis TaxID=59785 RepID=A0A6B2GAE1_MYXSQ
MYDLGILIILLSKLSLIISSEVAFEEKIFENSLPISHRYFQSKFIPDKFPAPTNIDVSLENMLQSIPGNNLFLDQRLIISSNKIVQKIVEDVNIDRYLLAKKFTDQLAHKNLSKNLKDCIRIIIGNEYACAVSYRWIDYGIKHYPRYVKEGFCSDTSYKRCCHPTHVLPYYILRWICIEYSKINTKCEWKIYKKYVITRCSCY